MTEGISPHADAQAYAERIKAYPQDQLWRNLKNIERAQAAPHLWDALGKEAQESLLRQIVEIKSALKARG